MGWCSATRIMDAAVSAADALAQRFRAFEEEHPCCPPATQEELDEILRPFVSAIAEKLRDGDWDCIEEADAFDRFRQEMLGYDHSTMAEWYRERLTEDYEPDAAQVREYSEKMAHHLEEANRGR